MIFENFVAENQIVSGGTATLVTVSAFAFLFPCCHNDKIMATSIVTLEDLEVFRQKLLADFQNILSQKKIVSTRRWLKSHEVMRLLLISPGTLQTLRLNGTIPFTKIGNVIFYEYKDIEKMIEEHKQTLGVSRRKRNR